jgi:hypothetical protein
MWAAHSQWQPEPSAFCLFLSNISLIYEGATGHPTKTTSLCDSLVLSIQILSTPMRSFAGCVEQSWVAYCYCAVCTVQPPLPHPPPSPRIIRSSLLRLHFSDPFRSYSLQYDAFLPMNVHCEPTDGATVKRVQLCNGGFCSVCVTKRHSSKNVLYTYVLVSPLFYNKRWRACKSEMRFVMQPLQK